MRKINKHISQFLFSLLAVTALVFSGCQNDVDDASDVVPATDTMGTVTINVTTPNPITADSYCASTVDEDTAYGGAVASGGGGTDGSTTGCTCVDGASSYTCVFSKVTAGTYYISSVVFAGQLNGGSPATGDFKGYYGTDSITAPSSANAVVVAGQDNVFNVTQEVIP